MNTAHILVDALLAFLFLDGPVEGIPTGEHNGEPGILVGD